jgi:hypothetical protein
VIFLKSPVACLTDDRVYSKLKKAIYLQLAKCRVEREAADLKQKALECYSAFVDSKNAEMLFGSLEHEVERLRNRLDRPFSVPSARSSPCKFDS